MKSLLTLQMGSLQGLDCFIVLACDPCTQGHKAGP